MYGYIYKRQNKLNGKIYIGQHKYNKPKLDESYRGSGKVFLKAVKALGDDAFTMELICIAETKEELNEKEIYYIQEYNSLVPNGYNVSLGGTNTGKDHYEESEIQRFKDNALGRHWYNNGVEEKFVYEKPEGFVEGRLKSINFDGCSGKVVMHDDSGKHFFCTVEEQAFYESQGYKRGRAEGSQPSFTAERRLKVSQKYSGSGNPMYGTTYTAMNKDGVNRRIDKDCVQQMLALGWQLGWKRKKI